jgi:hypothetical protein
MVARIRNRIQNADPDHVCLKNQFKGKLAYVLVAYTINWTTKD